jgi:hypothetical protein
MALPKMEVSRSAGISLAVSSLRLKLKACRIMIEKRDRKKRETTK